MINACRKWEYFTVLKLSEQFSYLESIINVIGTLFLERKLVQLAKSWPIESSGHFLYIGETKIYPLDLN